MDGLTSSLPEPGWPGLASAISSSRSAEDGVTTVNGNAVTDEAPVGEDSITVTIIGTLRTGIFAIGGETTGTTITAKGIAWELDFGENKEVQLAAKQWHEKRVRLCVSKIIDGRGAALDQDWGRRGVYSIWFCTTDGVPHDVS